MELKVAEQLKNEVNVVPFRKWLINNDVIVDAMHTGHVVILYMALFHFHYMG